MGQVEVLDAAVWWADGYGNDPEVTFLVDRLPEFGPYKKVPIEGTRDNFYWRESDSFASFFVWSGKPDDGFGGWRRTVQIDDGTEEEIVGGWSSNGLAAAALGFAETVPVVLADRKDTFDRSPAGGSRYHMLFDRFRKEVDRLLPNVEVIPAEYMGLTVKWCDQATKEEFMEAEQTRRDTFREQLKGFYGENRWYDLCSDEEQEMLSCRPYSMLGSV